MSRALGSKAEEVAKKFLQNLGYNILAMNISYKCGELDIIALDKKTMVFVEVKQKKDAKFSQPYEAVNFSKQKKIIKAAHMYLQKLKGQMPYCRFDVVSIVGVDENAEITHIKDAFIA